MSEGDKKNIRTNVIEKYAQDALRTVAITYRDIEGPIPEDEDEIQSNLILIGIIGIEDPVR